MSWTCGKPKLLMPLVAAIVAVLIPASALMAYPNARNNPRMVWDAGRGRVILFGGITAADSSRTRYYLNDTWQWEGRYWVPIYPKNPPSGRGAQAMVYDSVRDRTIVFGGIYGSDTKGIPLLLNDTWALEGDIWKKLSPTNSPPPRQLSAAAFDSTRGRMIVYGGFDAASASLFDTWEFDGENWAQITGGPQIANPLMVFDPARNQTLLLGNTIVAAGQTSVVEMYRRTETGWEKLAPSKLPSCIVFGGLTFEEMFNRVVFQGGGCIGKASVSETWLWHGNTWDQTDPFLTPAVTGFGFATDQKHHETILFGGTDFAETSQTYAYYSNEWHFLNEVRIPGPRSRFVFQADPSQGVTYFFGGLNDQSGTQADFWRFRAGQWESVKTDPQPTGCFDSVGTFDSDRKKLVLVCDSGATHEWDGTKWTEITGLTEKPSTARFRNIVYDPKLKKTIAYGGFNDINYLKETWLWDGAKWTRFDKNAKAPNPRSLAALFFDPVSQRTLLFGGIGRPTTDSQVTRYDDMWAFDGSKWTELTPAAKPPARYGTQIAFNPETNSVMMFGGKSGDEVYINEQWDWDGQTWKQVQSENTPSPRMNGALALDPGYGKMTLYGGYAGYYFQEIWTYSKGRWELQPYRGRLRPSRAGSSSPGGGANLDAPEPEDQ